MNLGCSRSARFSVRGLLTLAFLIALLLAASATYNGLLITLAWLTVFSTVAIYTQPRRNSDLAAVASVETRKIAPP